MIVTLVFRASCANTEFLYDSYEIYTSQGTMLVSGQNISCSSIDLSHKVALLRVYSSIDVLYKAAFTQRLFYVVLA